MKPVAFLIATLVAASWFDTGYAGLFCPDGWELVTDDATAEKSFFCAWFNPTLLSQTDAQTACQNAASGAFLAVPASDNVLTALSSGFGCGSEPRWIGGIRTSGAWKRLHLQNFDMPHTDWHGGDDGADGEGAQLETECGDPTPMIPDVVTNLAGSVCTIHLQHTQRKTFYPLGRWWSGREMSSGTSTTKNDAGASVGPFGNPDAASKTIGGETSITLTQVPDFTSQDFTFSAYVKWISGSGSIFVWNYAGNPGVELVSNAGVLTLELRADAATPTTEDSEELTGCDLTLNTWTHVRVTYDLAAGKVKGWLDGVSCFTSTGAALSATYATASGEMVIGGTDNLEMDIACVSVDYNPTSLNGIELIDICRHVSGTRPGDAPDYPDSTVFPSASSLVSVFPLTSFFGGREATTSSGAVLEAQPAVDIQFVSDKDYLRESAVNFDGTYAMDLEQSTLVNIVGNSFTYVVDVLPKATSAGSIFSYQNGFGLTIAGMDLTFAKKAVGGTATDVTFSGCLTDNVWAQVAVTYDRTSGDLAVFVDGTQCGTTDVFGANVYTDTLRNFQLGNSLVDTKLSCFGVYTAVLSSGDLTSFATACNQVKQALPGSYDKFDGSSVYRAASARLFLTMGKDEAGSDISPRQHQSVETAVTFAPASLAGTNGVAGGATVFNSNSLVALDKSSHRGLVGNTSVTYTMYARFMEDADGTIASERYLFNHHSVGGVLSTHAKLTTAKKFEFEVAVDGKLSVSFNSGCGGPAVAKRDAFLAFTFDAASGFAAIHMDGVLCQKQFVGYRPIGNYGGLVIGAKSSGVNSWLGEMSCFAIHKGALSGQEQRTAMANCKSITEVRYGDRTAFVAGQDLIGYWPLTTTHKAKDLASHRLHGSVGSAATFTSGYLDLVGNSQNSWVSVGQTTAQPFLDIGAQSHGFTLSVMFKDQIDDGTILGFYEGGTGIAGVSLTSSSAGNNIFTVNLMDPSSTDTETIDCADPGTRTVDVWHHIGFTFDASTGDVTAYLNGVVCGTYSGPSFTDGLRTVGDLRFGIESQVATAIATSLHCAHLYQGVRTAEQMIQITNKCLQPVPTYLTNIAMATATASWPLTRESGGLATEGSMHLLLPESPAWKSDGPASMATSTFQISSYVDEALARYTGVGQAPTDICALENSFTIAAWVFRDSAAGASASVLLSYAPPAGVEDSSKATYASNTYTDGLTITYDPSGNAFNVRYVDATGAVSTDLVATGFTNDAWHHIAVSYDSQTSFYRLFIDGSQTAESDSTADPARECSTSGADFMIGRKYVWPVKPSDDDVDSFVGSVSCLEMFNVGLSPDQLATLMSSCGNAPESLGCYKDAGNFDFFSNPGHYDAAALTNPSCASFCGLGGYKLAATQSGSTCRCGNVLGANSVRVSNQLCDSACSGDASQKCGGSSSPYLVSVSYATEKRLGATWLETSLLNCPNGWTFTTQGGGKCVKIVTIVDDYPTAQAACQKYGNTAQLASFRTYAAEEQALMSDLRLKDNIAASTEICVGLVSKTSTERVAYDELGRRVRDVTWANNEPSDNDGWVCEKDSTLVTVPKTGTGRSYLCEKSADGQDDFCPRGSTRIADSCYSTIAGVNTWSQAAASCAAVTPGSSLIELKSRSVFDRLYESLLDRHTSFWLNAKYDVATTQDQWQRDSSVVTGQGNMEFYHAMDVADAEKLCVVADVASGYRWRHVSCAMSQAVAVCQSPIEGSPHGLGLQTSRVSDRLMRASAADEGAEAYNARLNGPKAWCSVDTTASLTVDLEISHTLTHILIQGGAVDADWLTEFSVESSTDGVTWTAYTFTSASQTLDNGAPTSVTSGSATSTIPGVDAGSNQLVTLAHIFETPVVGRMFRITSISVANTKACARIELVGTKTTASDEYPLTLVNPVKSRIGYSTGTGVVIDSAQVSVWRGGKTEESGDWKSGTVTIVEGGRAVIAQSPYPLEKTISVLVSNGEFTSELSTTFEQALPMTSVQLGACRESGTPAQPLACNGFARQGTKVTFTTDYDGELVSTKTAIAYPSFLGEFSSANPTAAILGNSYMLANRMKAYPFDFHGFYVDMSSAGTFTLQVFEPVCSDATLNTYCPISHTCIDPTASFCVRQTFADGHTCGADYFKSLVKGDGVCQKSGGVDTVWDGPQLGSGLLPTSYRFVKEKTFWAPLGRSYVGLEVGEEFALGYSQVLSYYINGGDSGRILVREGGASSYMFEDSLSGFSTRLTSTFEIQNYEFTTQADADVQIIGVGQPMLPLSYTIQWSVAGVSKVITATHQDFYWPSEPITLTHTFEIVEECTDMNFEFTLDDTNTAVTLPAVFTTYQRVGFYVEPHPGSACQFTLNWDDDNYDNMEFDETTEANTRYHSFSRAGYKKVTLTGGNSMGFQTITKYINVQAPISKASIHIAQPPAQVSGLPSAVHISTSQLSANATFTVSNDDSFTSTHKLFDDICDTDWINQFSNGYCYRYFNGPLSAHDAAAYCGSLGGTLATISTPKSNGWSKMSYVIDAVFGGDDPWVGLRRLRSNGRGAFYTDEGEALAISGYSWLQNMAPTTGKDCVRYVYSMSSIFPDDCSIKSSFICQQPARKRSPCGDPSWTMFHDRCYKTYEFEASFAIAAATCQGAGGHLAEPLDLKTIAKLKDTPDFSTASQAWIGLFSEKTDEWVLRTADAYVSEPAVVFDPASSSVWNAAPGSGLEDMHCGGINSDGKLVQLNCGTELPFVCTKPIDASRANNYFVRTADRRMILNEDKPISCPTGWTNSGTLCYRKFATAQQFTDAESSCQSHGGTLARIQSTAEVAVASTLVPSGDAWTGLFQFAASSAWRFTDGSAEGSAPWAASEPLGAVTPGAAAFSGGELAEADPTDAKAYICQRLGHLGVREFNGGCPPQWREHEGRCFRMYSASPKTVANAHTDCKSAGGGGLARIATERDLAFFHSLHPLNVDVQDAWVGLSYGASDWEWSAGLYDILPLEMSNREVLWAPAEPSADSDCAKLTSTGLVQSACDDVRAYICEQPAAVCPDGWRQWGGNCYTIPEVDFNLNPYDDLRNPAIALCTNYDAFVVSPQNVEEVALLRVMAGADYPGVDIGLGWLRAESDTYIRTASFQVGDGFTDAHPSGSIWMAYMDGAGDRQWTSSVRTVKVACSRPGGYMSSEVCAQACLSDDTLNSCNAFQLIDRRCVLSQQKMSDDYSVLRSSAGHADVYTIKSDLCTSDLTTDVADAAFTATASGGATAPADARMTGTAWEPATPGTDTLTVDFVEPALVSAFKISGNSDNSQHVLTFSLETSTNGLEFFDYLYESTTPFLFTANDAETALAHVALPRSVLAKTIRIKPLTWTSVPSLRLSVVGCYAAIYSQTISHTFSAVGDYTWSLSGTSPENTLTAITDTTSIQTPIAGLVLDDPGVIERTTEGTITYHLSAGSHVTWNATFGGNSLAGVGWDEPNLTGATTIYRSTYADFIGDYELLYTADNWVSDPITATAVLWVDFTVLDLQYTPFGLNALNAIEPDTDFYLDVTFRNCSRCDLTVSYKDLSDPGKDFTDHYPVHIQGTVLTLPTIQWAVQGYYEVQFDLVNPLNSETKILPVWVQRAIDPATTVLTLPGDISMPPGTGNFDLDFTGVQSMFPMGINVTYSMGDGSADFNLDGIADTAATGAGASDTNLMHRYTHTYLAFGDYSITTTISNRINSLTKDVDIKVDQEFTGATLQAVPQFIVLGEPTTLYDSVVTGSRYTWKVKLEDNTESAVLGMDGSFETTFPAVGVYRPYYSYWNAIDNIVEEQLVATNPIVVQYPCTSAHFQIRSNQYSTLFFDPPNPDPTTDTNFELWVDTALQWPSDPFISVDFDNGLTFDNASLVCDAPVEMDGTWKKCKIFTTTFSIDRAHMINMTVSNLASESWVAVNHWVYSNIIDLDFKVEYLLSEVNGIQTWADGKGPSSDPALRDSFFPVGKKIRFTMSLTKGSGLQHCWNFGQDGASKNPTICPNDHTIMTNDVVEYTYTQDKPCKQNLPTSGVCGMNVILTSSNPASAATVTKTIHLQKPSVNVNLMETGPSQKHNVHPIWLKFDEIATDACIKVDYGSTVFDDQGARVRYTGSRYMCTLLYQNEADFAEIMANFDDTENEEYEARNLQLHMTYGSTGHYKIRVHIMNYFDETPLLGPADKITTAATWPANQETMGLVTSGACSYPSVSLDAPSQILMSQALTLDAAVKLNCTVYDTMVIHWEAQYRESPLAGWGTCGHCFMPSDAQKIGSSANPVWQPTPINFGETSLLTGYYKFTLQVYMNEEPLLEKSLSVETEVTTAAMIAILPPGPIRDVAFGKRYVFDAFVKSYDPNTGTSPAQKSVLEVLYFCKRGTVSSWPELAPTEIDIADLRNFVADPYGYYTYFNSATMDSDNFGCFRKDTNFYLTKSLTHFSFEEVKATAFGLQNLPSADYYYDGDGSAPWAFNLSTEFMYNDETANLMAVVLSGPLSNPDTTWGLSFQNIRIAEGEPPVVNVETVTNAAYKYKTYVKLNPTSRASFSGSVQDPQPGEIFLYNWTIVRVPDGWKVESAMEVIGTMIQDNSLPESEWLPKTSSGRYSKDISFDAGLFDDDKYYRRNFIVYLEVMKVNLDGSGGRGSSAMKAFYVNEPPKPFSVKCFTNRLNATAMVDRFTFDCDGFTDDDGKPEKYTFSVQPCTYCPITYLTPTLSTPRLLNGVGLPAGVPEENYQVTVYLEAFDKVDSMSRVYFHYRVEPLTDFADIQRYYNRFEISALQMSPEDLAEQMYGFSDVLNTVEVKPIYQINQTAYEDMGRIEKQAEQILKAKDTIRFNKETKLLETMRWNATVWMKEVGLPKEDMSAIKTFCGAISNLLNRADQTKDKRISDNAQFLANSTVFKMKDLVMNPEIDADGIDAAFGVCSGVLGNMAKSITARAKILRAVMEEEAAAADPKLAAELAAKKTATSNAVDDEVEIPTIKMTEQEREELGTLKTLENQAERINGLIAELRANVKQRKVQNEARSVVVGQGSKMGSSVDKTDKLGGANLAAGGDDDCGGFKIGSMADTFLTNAPEGTNMTEAKSELENSDMEVRSGAQEGNPYAFSDSASELNSDTQTLAFGNPDGNERPVYNLPYEIEIVIESQNQASPDDTKLYTFSKASHENMSQQVFSITPNGAVFVDVKRWEALPCLYHNFSIEMQEEQWDEMGKNFSKDGSPCIQPHTQAAFERWNDTYGWNVTEEVVFFVYINTDGSEDTRVNETNSALMCTLPAKRYETIFNETTNELLEEEEEEEEEEEPVGPVQGPVESYLPYIDPADCVGGLDYLGRCPTRWEQRAGKARLKMEPRQKKKKVCSAKKKLDVNSCFFDHRNVNVTDGKPRTAKIGIRAMTRSALEEYISFLHTNTSGAITMEEAKDKAFKEGALENSVKVGYVYSTFSTSCQFWNEPTKTWDTEGCRVSPFSDPGGYPSVTRCMCNHLTSFGSSLDVPMNTFDPSENPFAKLDENPICFTFGICVFCFWITVMVWARKRDKEDEAKWGATPLPDNDPRDKYAYELTIWTGLRANAGTSAHVTFILSGDQDETEPRLMDDMERPILQQGGVDSFLMTVPRSLGKIQHLRIWHDNSGKAPAWYFSRMMAIDLQTGRQFYFLNDRWLAVEEDDGMVDRIVPVAGRKDMQGFEHLFSMTARRRLTDSHLWFSVISRPPRSKFTRCQRLTCCVSVLYCSCLANIMFFGIDVSKSTESVQIGPLSFSLTSIIISLISALIVVPANLLIVQLFRLSKHKPTKREEKMEAFRTAAMQEYLLDRQRRKRGLAATPSSKNVMDPFAVTPEEQAQAEAYEGMKAQKKKKDKKKKKAFRFPWWCIYLGYALAFSVCMVCFWAIVMYGGTLGPEKSAEWIGAMMISFVTDVLFMQPLKVMMLALLFALICKNPKDEDVEEHLELRDDEEYTHQPMTTMDLNDPEKREWLKKRKEQVFLPPDPSLLEQAREARLKELEMISIIKEMFIYVVFLYLIMLICYTNMDAWHQQLANHAQHMFFDGAMASAPGPAWAGYNNLGKTSLLNIGSREDFWYYIENVIVPTIYGDKWYNGEAFDENSYIADQANHLVGPVRLRQMRTKIDSCKIAKAARKLISECIGEYSITSEEARDFKPRWQAVNESDPDDKPHKHWSFTSVFKNKGAPIQAMLKMYGGGGYIVELPKNVNVTKDILANLKEKLWVDRQTRAVFIEFNLFNPNKNIYTVSEIIVEFFEGGGAVIWPKLNILKLDRYTGSWMVVVMGLEIFTGIFILVFLGREIKKIGVEGKAYFKSFWNCLEFFFLCGCIVAGSFSVGRIFVSKIILSDYQENPDKYINFTYAVFYDTLTMTFLGIACFVATAKFIRLLRFNRRVTIMVATIKNMSGPLSSFFMVFFFIYFAFVQLAYFFFGAKLAIFNKVITATETLFSIMLNKFDFNELAEGDATMGPIFFLAYVLIINILMVNIMLTLIIMSFEEIRSDPNHQKNQYELLDYIGGKIGSALGMKPKEKYQMMVDKQFKYHGDDDRDDIEMFHDKMEELMAKLEDQCEETKQEFPEMFDDRTLNRVHREVYNAD